MTIIFTEHAKIKFKVLRQHGFEVNEMQIRDIVENPETTSKGKKARLILQSPIDDTHVIRVICEIESDNIKVITFYPARRERYENQL
jgi:uncharacterized DUF497 family protein